MFIGRFSKREQRRKRKEGKERMGALHCIQNCSCSIWTKGAIPCAVDSTQAAILPSAFTPCLPFHHFAAAASIQPRIIFSSCARAAVISGGSSGCGPSIAMTSSGERTSAEVEGSMLPSRENTDEVLRPPSVFSSRFSVETPIN